MSVDLSRFHDSFFDESLESLATMEATLLRFEAGATGPEAIHTVFRVAHSLKGGAGMFGFDAIVSFTHTLESVLDALRAGRLAVDAPLTDLLLGSVDLLRGMLEATRAGGSIDAQRVADLQFDLELQVARSRGKEPRNGPATVAPDPAPKEPPANAANAAGGDAPDAGSIRVDVGKLDDLLNAVGELVITQTMLAQFARGVAGADERLQRGLLQLERNVRDLQESVMRVRMLPISAVFSRFPRLVRDLAQRCGKQIELRLGGEHTELDKTVLEKIGDPLVHLVRNSIDHGIEPPDVRIARGKSPAGTIRLDASQRGGCIVVEVRDDGGGLDRRRIIERARSRGLIAGEAEPDDTAISELIFSPGFSTAEEATEVSGRGVGMDVVRRNVKALGGSIEVESRAGEGARFTLTLPFTLAIVEGQTVAVGAERYVVPVTSIIESLRLQPGGATRIAGSGSDVITFRGDFLPVLRLHELFGVESANEALHGGLIMVVEGDGRRAGLFVDQVEGQLQAVVKSMEANYRAVDGVSGATITADGNVALILDVPALVRMAGRARRGALA
ncbi:MAG: hypothetical protein CMLOHMNK_00658 [Steroidobacteraceae bacterium]|nr:hypothetical protein [Steroidobacteraceae bacterium]